MRILFVFALLFASFSAAAYDNLDSLFNHIKAMNGADSVKVDFTGGFPKNSDVNFGFTMMRGEGKGHTRGTRSGVPNVSAEQADSIFEIFETKSPWGRSDYYKTCYDERRNTVYSLYFNEISDSLYMIRAKVDEETSLPYDWPFRTHYNAEDSIQFAMDVPLNSTSNGINWTEVLVRLYDEVRYNFAFYHKIKSRWKRAYNRHLAAIKEAKDDYEALRIVQRMIALCADGHTHLILPEGYMEVPGWSPFTTVMLPDGLYVNTVESRELIDAGMKRGQKIIAVNGESPEAWAKRELLPYVCSSTPQWTINQMYDDYNFTRTRYGSPMDLTLENPDGSQLELPHRVNAPSWDSSLATIKKPDFSIIDHNIGLLTIPDFQSAKPAEFFDSIYSEIKGTKALIIDLRNNGGGNSNYADYIARHLIGQPIPTKRWSTRIYKPAFASWGYDEEIYTSKPDSLCPLPEITPYLNPIVLLTNRGTFSAAEDFTALLKSAKRVTQIGTSTGGSTGNGVRPILSNVGSITANICSKHDVSPDGTEFVGIGLIPDIIIEESSETFFDPKRDKVIESAIDYLKSIQH